jgi:PadR family transcriptional regulator
MSTARNDILHGTLTVLVLKTLASEGLTHGYAIASYIQQVSGHLLRIEEGSLYPALRRMSRAGWLRSEVGRTETRRPATFYALTPAGYRQLEEELARWACLRKGVSRVLDRT